MKNKPLLSFLFLLICLNAFGQKRSPEVDNALTRISLNLLEADYTAAIASYNELIVKDPKNESEYCYKKGICYYRTHEDSLGKETFRSGLNRKNLYAGNNLGLSLYMVGSNSDSALIYLRKVVVALKDSLQVMQNVRSANIIDRRQVLSDAFHNMGLVFLQKGLPDSAQYYLYQAMDISPAADEHFLATSYFYYKSNNFEKAYSFAKIALELDRYEARSALLMGIALEKQGKLTKAISFVKELIVVQEVALSQWKRGDGTLKKDLMSSYQTRGYKQMQEINADFYVILSYLHYKKNEKELSAEAYKKAIKLNPEVYYNISNEASFKAFMEAFLVSKLQPPVAPKDYLPVYRNLFSVKGNSGGGRP